MGKVEKTIPAGTVVKIEGIPLELKKHTVVLTTEENFKLAFEEMPNVSPMTTEESREYYQQIRDGSLELSEAPDLNQTWKTAYQNLASAADHVDAMLARTVIGSGAA